MGIFRQSLEFKITKMKLAATLIAFVAAQAPPASKTCPDCQDWHGAARTLVEAKPHLVQEWAIAAGKEQCQVIWEDDALCRYFVGGGFINWAESWLKRMDASSWCSAYTMCAKKPAPVSWEKFLKWPTPARPAKTFLATT